MNETFLSREEPIKAIGMDGDVCDGTFKTSQPTLVIVEKRRRSAHCEHPLDKSRLTSVSNIYNSSTGRNNSKRKPHPYARERWGWKVGFKGGCMCREVLQGGSARWIS